MPYAIRKMPNQSCYRVYNKKTHKIFAKCSSKKNAEKQVRLLRGIENNRTFRNQVKARQLSMRRNKTMRSK